MGEEPVLGFLGVLVHDVPHDGEVHVAFIEVDGFLDEDDVDENELEALSG